MKKTFIVIVIFLLNLAITNAQDSEKVEKAAFLNETINISGIYNGEIEKSKLLISNGLTFGRSLDSMYRIAGFKMTLVIKGRDLLEFQNSKSNELTSFMIEAIKVAPIDSKIFFEYIRCVDKNGTSYSVNATQFIIK